MVRFVGENSHFSPGKNPMDFGCDLLKPLRGQKLDTRGGGKLLDMNGKGLTKRYKIFFKTADGFQMFPLLYQWI